MVLGSPVSAPVSWAKKQILLRPEAGLPVRAEQLVPARLPES